MHDCIITVYNFIFIDVIIDFDSFSGTEHHHCEVVSWTPYQVAHSQVESFSSFEVSVNKSVLQHHDQDSGRQYLFSIQAYNRAGLFISQRSDPFQIHSKQLPTTGIVYHVVDEISTEPIGFQEDLAKFCARWFGFSHHSEVLNISIGIGTEKFVTDIHPFVNADYIDHHCIYLKSVVPYRKYFITVKASNKEGFSISSTQGVFVGNSSEILEHSRINIGSSCHSEFRSILFSRFLYDKSSDLVLSGVYVPFTSLTERILRISFSHIDFGTAVQFGVYINDKQINITTWKFIGNYKIMLFYNFVHDSEEIEIRVEPFNKTLSQTVTEIALDECKADCRSQLNTDYLFVQFSFNPKANNFITHFEAEVIEVNPSIQSNSGFTPVGNHTQLYFPTYLHKDSQLVVKLRPCFSVTCIDYITSHSVVLDRHPLTFTQSFAELHKDPASDVVDTNAYLLIASWKAENSQNKDDIIIAYDYGVALNEDGTGMLTQWTRHIVTGNDLVARVGILESITTLY